MLNEKAEKILDGFSKEDLVEVVKVLKEIKIKDMSTAVNGICYYIVKRVPKMDGPIYRENLLSEIAKNWKYYSGNIDFPIPVTDGALKTPCEQYRRKKYKWTGKQGEIRKDLCQFLINKIEDYLKERKHK